MKITEIYDVINCVVYKQACRLLTAEDKCLLTRLRLEKGWNEWQMMPAFLLRNWKKKL